MRLLPLALAAALFAGSAYADVTLNLKDAEINTLISTVSEVTGKNFIVDPRVKGKVTVISATPMDKKAVYETFLAVLQVQGFAAVPAGNAVKIIPETNARSDAGIANRSGAGMPLDDVVTHVFALQNVSAAQLVPILRPLVPQWGHLAAYPGNNMLVISDRAGNVARLADIINKLDNGGDRDIESVPLENAAAAEVVRILTTMIQQNKQADPTASAAAVIADERSNAVLVGGDKTERARIISIIQRLDSPLKDNDGATQVVYLRYASAENLAPILEGYAQQANSSASGSSAPATPASSASSGSGGFEKTRVLADKDTNALVITAPPKTMRQIRNVIAQLDIQRPQVLVQAIIAEVSVTRSSQLGLDFAVYNPNGGAAASILDSSTLSALTSVATTGNPLAGLGALGQGINIGGAVIQNEGRSGTSFAVLLKALRSDGDTNVLSTPTLTSLDNEESEVSVGQEVPFLSGSYSNSNTTTSGTVNPFQTIERKDVGLKLGVTPQINEGNSVKLKIKLESSSVASGGAGTANLVTNKRTITNTVNVDSGQVLVLGGLTDDNLNDGVSGVPLLSSIPVLGNLFKSRSVSKVKRNLMVFIHPTILRSKEEGDFYTQRKYDSVRDIQVRAAEKSKVPLIGGSRIVMPELEAYIRDNTAPPSATPPAALRADSPSVDPASTPAPSSPSASSSPAPTPIPPPAAAAPTPAPAPAATVDRSKLAPNVLVIPAERPSTAAPAGSR
ncbi:type II secretion system protein GspD [Stagnimonas aquatica]|uniref:Type II secretion system protein GspD n=1 Tax=Stagnimonas aquatica TaxID=2689987 RepID=A0A3N0V8N4_9GAMM|nr:type II secretion system secretin GspD [Stagnimonas aquatica]ROH89160.1 type II secretion system protein GspD [Stagnimonas aquatica]